MKVYRILAIFFFTIISCLTATAADLTKSTIVHNPKDHHLVEQMAKVLSEDIERVSGTCPEVSTVKGKGPNVFLSTVSVSGRHKELKGQWETYSIDTIGDDIFITGSDPRGLAYGVFHLSEQIGVNPWYWFADIPVDRTSGKVRDYVENFVSTTPTIKYRGIFINDEDWGMKTWSERNFEKELGDIGPKTYDKVCELLLRLKANMLAPAMHSCTGAFYSYPENQVVADKWGIMITTSHCEPLLFNNAAASEWTKSRDGEWNYETNSKTILQKLDDRIRETAQYDNIYTMGLRGLHDEAMKGSTDPADRARTLEKVFDKQRGILSKYKKQRPESIRQIFVPYKETLDIYDAGLRVPEDITLVWPDDNYGYMKRVSNNAEQKRSGGSGIYYHISYCGTPHDNLWIATTAPQLMYEELQKAYSSGADRYWLLNVGDIKPMEIEMQMFLDMAYDFPSFSYDNVNRAQAEWLASVYGEKYLSDFQFILDHYYRLAWDRKPEFMGYEMEWDSPQYSRLYDTDFSFSDGSAQKRLVEYQDICYLCNAIENELAPEFRPSFFEILGYSVNSAYQMNRKFLYAQANHETGNLSYASQSKDAIRKLQELIDRYHSQLDGKWDQMISEICPGYTALYQNTPDYVSAPTDSYRLPDNQRHTEFRNKIALSDLDASGPFRLLEGIGTDWVSLQMGQPLDFESTGSIDIPITEDMLAGISSKDTIRICISVVPMWPVAYDRSNRIAVSFDGSSPVICENRFIEWSREWKIQVLENRKEFVLTFPVSDLTTRHKLILSIVDPGQIVQSITFE